LYHRPFYLVEIYKSKAANTRQQHLFTFTIIFQLFGISSGELKGTTNENVMPTG
jgi:hypothetical protein